MRIYSAGSNAHGQLAHGGDDDSDVFRECIDFDDTRQREDFTLLDIATGANHTLVLLETSEKSTSLYGCGDGSKGQLGSVFTSQGGRDLTTFHRLELTFLNGQCIKQIAACWETSFVLVSDDEQFDALWSMGSNAYGLRGNGKSINQCDLESSLVDFTGVLHSSRSKVNICSLTAGPNHVIAKLIETTTDGPAEHIVGWGASRHGQLSPSKLPYLSTPSVLSINASDIFALGMQHTIASRIGGSVVAMGSNKKNQLRGLDNCNNVVAIGATWNGSYVVVESNGATETGWRIVVSGSSVVPSDIVKDGIGLSEVPYQKLPFDAAAYTLLGLACGSEHVLLHVRRNNGGEAHQNEEVWGWGWNEHGNLGTGNTSDVIEPKLIWPPHNDTTDTNEKVVRVHAGYGTSWVVVEDVQEVGVNTHGSHELIRGS